jgi:hypothetical protein
VGGADPPLSSPRGSKNESVTGWITLHDWSQVVAPLVMLGGAALLVSPWIVQLMRSFTLGIRGSEGRYGPAYYSLERLGDGWLSPAFVLIVGLGLVGIAAGVVMRQRLFVLLGVWAAIQLALSNPGWVPLPVAGQVDTVTVLTSLFFPLGLGIGLLAAGFARRLRTVPPRLSLPFAAAALGLAVCWGSQLVPSVVHPDRGLADRRDVAAAQWVAAQIPPQAIFLVNGSIAHWEPDFMTPTDGGYWLPLLTGRRTTLLPMLYAAERGVSPGQIERTERLVDATAADPTSDEALALLRAFGVTHIYLGVGGGPIDGQKLQASQRFRLVYRGQGTAIYEVVE